MKKLLRILVAKLVSKKIVQTFGTLGLIAGIISDVLQPLAPFTSYLFFASAIFFVLLLFTYLFFKRLRIKVLTSLTIAIIILFFSGAFYILQNITNSKDSGILSNIKTVEDLQVNLGFIDKSLGEIKEDTTIIKEDTKIIKEVTNFIMSKLKSIEEMSKLKSIEEKKKTEEAKEKETAESIPDWYLNPPQGSDVLMYIRGSAVSDQLQLALDLATNAALKNLGKKVKTRLASKSQECIRQAGIGEDQVSKTEINLISSTVVDEITVSGYETVETKLVSLDNGSYRAFILLKYPVAKAYKSYIEKIEESPELKGRLTEIKNTDIYKELKKAVAQYSGF